MLTDYLGVPLKPGQIVLYSSKSVWAPGFRFGVLVRVNEDKGIRLIAAHYEKASSDKMAQTNDIPHSCKVHTFNGGSLITFNPENNGSLLVLANSYRDEANTSIIPEEVLHYLREAASRRREAI